MEQKSKIKVSSCASSCETRPPTISLFPLNGKAYGRHPTESRKHGISGLRLHSHAGGREACRNPVRCGPWFSGVEVGVLQGPGK